MPVTQDDRPVTKRELKADISDLKAFVQKNFATKKDLVEALKNHPTKDDMNKAIRDLEIRLRASFVADVKVLNEQLVYDFRGALEDKISLHDDTLVDHRKRIERLERRSGLLM